MSFSNPFDAYYHDDFFDDFDAQEYEEWLDYVSAKNEEWDQERGDLEPEVLNDNDIPF